MHKPVTSDSAEQVSRRGFASLLNNLWHSAASGYILLTIKIMIGIALLILSIRGIQFENLIIGIKYANVVWLILAIFSVLLGLFLKFWRWVLFIRHYQVGSNLTRLFSAYFVGQAANIILPFRSGELVRMGYFAAEPKILPEILSTIALEKYLDLMALTVCAILVSLKFSLDNILNLRGLLLPLTLILTLLSLVVIFFGPQAWSKIRSGNLPERISEWLDRWVQVSQWLRQPRKTVPGIFLTILIWVVMWMTNLLLSRSLGTNLVGTAAGLVLVAVYVGLLPALMPGNIGPFYFFASLALLPFGIQHDQAFTFAVILHAIVTLPPLLAGLIGLFIHPAAARVS